MIKALNRMTVVETETICRFKLYFESKTMETCQLWVDKRMTRNKGKKDYGLGPEHEGAWWHRTLR